MECRRPINRSTRMVVLGFASAFIATMSMACAENPVGRKCFIGDAADPTSSVVASPALECPSRTCLQVPLAAGVELPPDSEYTSLCTAECNADEDCDKVPESPCQTGFACAIPVYVGPFCCRKMCMCRDYLVIPETGLPEPAACISDNPDNACCNLPGRQGNDLYPNC